MVGLDHNHSHFILVETDGTSDAWDAVMPLRREFEKCLGKHNPKSVEEEEQQGRLSVEEEEQTLLEKKTQPIPIVSICGTEHFTYTPNPRQGTLPRANFSLKTLYYAYSARSKHSSYSTRALRPPPLSARSL